MSMRSAPGKPKTPKTKAATPIKSRLSGPKPPKASKVKTVSKSATPAVATPKTVGIPAPTHSAHATPDAPLGDELKKRELVDLVVERSGIKKKDAKPVVEAMLAILGETVAKGREMNLQPLGRVKYNRTKETPAARVVVTKIRQSKGGNKPKTNAIDDKIADAAE